MATDLPEARPLPLARARPRKKRFVDDVFRRLNEKIEPRVRSGLGSPGLLPAGLIVLETTGRKSGKTRRTPLAVTRGPGGYLWVSTVLGRRANWLRNARANPDIRYWLRGRLHNGRALVSAPGYPLPDLSGLPPLVRWAATRGVKTSCDFGFGILIIVPVADDVGE